MTKIAFKSIKVFNEISKDFAVQTDGDFSRCTKNQHLRMFGTTKDMKYHDKPAYTQEPKWFILTPDKRFFMVWNMIVVLLL